jgi:hypothetical protein
MPDSDLIPRETGEELEEAREAFEEEEEEWRPRRWDEREEED